MGIFPIFFFFFFFFFSCTEERKRKKKEMGGDIQCVYYGCSHTVLHAQPVFYFVSLMALKMAGIFTSDGKKKQGNNFFCGPLNKNKRDFFGLLGEQITTISSRIFSTKFPTKTMLEPTRASRFSSLSFRAPVPTLTSLSSPFSNPFPRLFVVLRAILITRYREPFWGQQHATFVVVPGALDGVWTQDSIGGQCVNPPHVAARRRWFIRLFLRCPLCLPWLSSHTQVLASTRPSRFTMIRARGSWPSSDLPGMMHPPTLSLFGLVPLS